MDGRGKPQKAKSPNSNRKETNPKPPAKSGCTTVEEETKNETTKRPKKREQQQQKQTKEKSCAPKTVRARTTNHPTEEAKKKKDKTADSTKTKTYSAKKTTMETTSGFTSTHAQLKPETPKDITNASLKIPAVKPPNGKAKLQVHFTKDLNTEVKQPVQKIQTDLSAAAAATKLGAANMTREKKCANKTACGRTEVQPDGTQDKERILRMTLDKLKIKKVDTSEATKVVNDFMKQLIKYLKSNSKSFKEVGEPLRTGSQYEHLKVSLFSFLNIFSEHVVHFVLLVVVSYTIIFICLQISNPDEFDIMLPILVPRVQIDPFGTNGAFYSVQLKRGLSPLKKFQQAERSNVLSGSEMLKDFREEVKKFAKDQSGQ